MTIKELINILRSYPEESTILLQGYEGGFSEISEVKYVGVKLNVYQEEWSGPHEIDEKSQIKSLILTRRE